VKEKALGQNVLTAFKPSQLMVKIVHDELTALMGGTTADVNLKGSPAIILMSGLQGSGKTTFSGKLASMLKSKRGKNPLLVACDVYRPAAIEQLRILGEQINVPVYSEEDNKNPVEIAKHAIAEAKKTGKDLVIIDTAGRLAIDEMMMEEITNIKKAVSPNEILFVVDAMTGQDFICYFRKMMMFSLKLSRTINHINNLQKKFQLLFQLFQKIALPGRYMIQIIFKL
jgi:signal recognition particle subunit SRP54